MRAELLIRRRVAFGERDFAELVVWRVPMPVPPTDHGFKYRFVYVVDGVRVIGFDNERGNGDHRHDEGRETPYHVRNVDRLLDDFVGAWRKSHGKD